MDVKEFIHFRIGQQWHFEVLNREFSPFRVRYRVCQNSSVIRALP